MKFDGKVAVVTGSTGGLGNVVVRKFLSEGAKVVAVFRSKKKFKTVFKDVIENENLFPVKADVTREGDVKALFKAVRKKFKKVDILVNCVGGYLEKRMVMELDEDEFDDMLDINLRSTFLCCKWALRSMVPRRSGRIVNISALAVMRPFPGVGAYVASKAGVVALTEVIAEEVKDFDITCNVILPGMISYGESVSASVPWVTPDEVAELILYLCSDEAGGVNGALIKVAGKFR